MRFETRSIYKSKWTLQNIALSSVQYSHSDYLYECEGLNQRKYFFFDDREGSQRPSFALACWGVISSLTLSRLRLIHNGISTLNKKGETVFKEHNKSLFWVFTVHIFQKELIFTDIIKLFINVHTKNIDEWLQIIFWKKGTVFNIISGLWMVHGGNFPLCSLFCKYHTCDHYCCMSNSCDKKTTFWIQLVSVLFIFFLKVMQMCNHFSCDPDGRNISDGR